MADPGIFFEIGVFATALMVIGWVISIIRQRAEVVDVLWSYGTALAALWCAYYLPGNEIRRVLLGVLAAIWGARLGTHLFLDRFLAPEEDGRYQDLRKSWGRFANAKFLLFFLLQASLIVFLSTAFFAVGTSNRPIEWHDFLAVIIGLSAIVGEYVSDRQLLSYKNSVQSGALGLCQKGLWQWSRHPNYFFEWLYWMSFPILAFGGDYFYLAFLSPILMFYLIRFVTGVPPSEERMKASRGALFEEYQKKTNVFLPMPPKE